jgi:hypothetical protein
MRWTRIEGYVSSQISRERCLAGVSIAWDGKKNVHPTQKQNFDLDWEWGRGIYSIRSDKQLLLF